MFSNADIRGNCDLKIGSFSARINYTGTLITDVVNQFLNYWKETPTLSMNFETFGSNLLLVSNGLSTYIIEETDVSKLTKLDVDLLSLTNELIKDIDSDFDTWADGYEMEMAEEEEDLDEEAIDDYREDLAALIDELKAVVSELNADEIETYKYNIGEDEAER